MKTSVKSFVVLISCGLFACQPGKQIIQGETGNLNTNKMYLCEVVSDYWKSHRAVDSADVIGGKFMFELENVQPELYFLGDSPNHGGYFFLDGKRIKVQPENVTEEEISWKVEGSFLDQKYRAFMEQWDEATFKQITDSLDALFFQARDAGNREEMARIKEESMHYYDEGRIRSDALVKEVLEKNKENSFGMYLYYYKQFQHKDFPMLEEIIAEKAYIESFGAAAKNTRYLPWVMEKLGKYEGCAIGHEAPKIVGKDTLGNELKLSDLRGNYVLVDFWNSYCHWCREETPALKRALEHFARKNFKILGVSSDRVKKLWMDAIHEDGSYWDHLMLEKGDDVMDRYCIKGIPHIILVGPDGKILAKELRGQDLIDVPDQFVK